MPESARILQRFFQQASEQFPVLLVSGPRQSGKTTFLLSQCDASQTYVNLEDPLLCAQAKEDPELFLQRYAPPVVIDEIQNALELLPHIHAIVQEDNSPGQFWLSSSQPFLLRKSWTIFAAGQTREVHLHSFSQGELQSRNQNQPFMPTEECLKQWEFREPLLLPELFEQIWLGSFPGLPQDSAVLRDRFYGSYVQNFLQQDVRDQAHVNDSKGFLKWMRACAAHTAQILNIQDLCREAEINHATGKRWLTILENSGLVYLLYPFQAKERKRLVHTPKLYFLETGLAAWLVQWSSAATLESGPLSQAFLETWILSEVLKSWWYQGKQAPLFYYRDKDKKEVPLLLYQSGSLYPMTIQKTTTPGPSALRDLKVLDLLPVPQKEGCVFSFHPNRLPLSDRIHGVPAAMV